jgi:protein ImuA
MIDLAQLRARISALEGIPLLSAEKLPSAVPLGLPAIDAVLPWGGLPAGGLHEIRPERAGRPAAALGFAAFCLGRLARHRPGPLVWVSLTDDLYPPGLAELGLPVERLLLVRPTRPAEALWSLEEALRCQAVAGLLGEVQGLDFKAARRLSLATRASGVPALLLNRGAELAALLTRWRVAALPSRPPLAVGVGAPAWRLTLARWRGLAMGEEEQAPQWQVEVKHATGGLGLVAYSQHRPSRQAGQRRAG